MLAFSNCRSVAVNLRVHLSKTDVEVSAGYFVNQVDVGLCLVCAGKSRDLSSVGANFSGHLSGLSVHDVSRRVAQALRRRFEGLELILLGAHAANRTTRPFRLGVYSLPEGAPPFGLQGWGGSGMPKGLERRYGKGELHFTTFSCYRRLPLLDSVPARNAFVKTLGQVRERFHFAVIGYVVMPEHVHLLIGEPK